MIYYLGITNGPVIETLGEAGSPAGLWFGSCFFSSLTRKLCLAFLEKFNNDIEILSPYFNENQEEFLADGVGKYHDRIMLKISCEENQEALSKIVDDIIHKTKIESLKAFPINYHNDTAGQFFLQNYIQCHYVLMTDEDMSKTDIEGNVILKLSPYLDALELMQVFPDNDSNNLFYKLFNGKETNKEIKATALFNAVADGASQLVTKSADGNRIWSIEEIANCHGAKKENSLKKYNYFAVVQADGDRVGKLLKSIRHDDAVKAFSKKCMDYAHQAADMVGSFGGMTIYAGGDDLLFLAPVENADGKTVFELCEELNEQFCRSVNDGSASEQATSLSFGIAIRYKRFPLYEALRAATWLLLGEAKKEPKNNMAIDLQKHSGQTISIKIPVKEHVELRKLYALAIKKLPSIYNKVTMGTSIIQTLSNNSMILSTLDKAVLHRIEKGDDARTQFLTGWCNFQDNDGQSDLHEYYEAIGNLYYDCFLKNGTAIEAFGGILQSDRDKKLRAMIMYLKLNKFLMEQAGEDE